MRNNTQFRRALWGLLAAAALATTTGGGNAFAQQFEYVYGSPTCVETGLHGVKQLAAGGYVAVGESFQQVGGCGTSNAYVVVTNPAGGFVWTASYVVGTNSRATDVLELANGDLIVCGYATIGAPCHAGVSKDIFVLHLAANGALIGANTYGGSTTDEEAWKIIRATVGDNITTFAGDYIIAGSSTNQNAPGMRGGYLLRVNAGLALIWDRQYGTSANDDYFQGVDEVPVGLAGAGDVVATGGSNSPPAAGNDVFVVRVNGNNGMIGAAPQGQSWTNFVAATSFDEGRAVIVLRKGPNAGDIVITGYTTGAPAPSTSDEAFVLELSPNPCVQIANVYFGDNGAFSDRGNDLVEDANPSVAGGDVVVTGYASLPNGFGQRDVFLQRVSNGPGMGLIGPVSVFGGTTVDEGGAVSNAVHANPVETPGYIVNGLTQSPNLIGAADPQQLYLIKTDVVLNTLCNRRLAFRVGIAPKATVCGAALGPNIGLQCAPNIPLITWQSGQPVCPPPPPNMPRDRRDGNEGVAGVENGAALSFAEGRMTTYPDPVRSGEYFNLRFELNTPATAHIVVSDISGRELYSGETRLDKGTQLIPVNTEGWPAGAYLVRVGIGTVTATSHVVVMEK
jgi:hypothetical protein